MSGLGTQPSQPPTPVLAGLWPRSYSFRTMSMPSPAAQLRTLLRRPGPALVLGAHDALSAKLAEEAGFDAVWASGFCISAASAMPDANILTMSETLDAVRRMS